MPTNRKVSGPDPLTAGRLAEDGALSRRDFVALGAAAAGSAAFLEAHAGQGGTTEPGFRRDMDSNAVEAYANVHGGQGSIDIKFFSDFSVGSAPSLLLIYTIPVGASEGVHTHRPGDTKEGSFDEFYYIIEGQGEMEIAGEVIAVKPGDHVFTPNGVAHGIANTSTDQKLKVFLTAIRRE